MVLFACFLTALLLSCKTRCRAGSSPHMRGKPYDVADFRQYVRIIPAHAGQTARAGRARMRRSDHPRTCGANSASTRITSAKGGSSPHMRGKLLELGARVCVARIIPAHAGQTRHRHESRPRRADHPRTCGANCTMSKFGMPVRGSSPHMRDKHPTNPNRQRPCRIIPAHAGQTRCRRRDLHW